MDSSYDDIPLNDNDNVMKNIRNDIQTSTNVENLYNRINSDDDHRRKRSTNTVLMNRVLPFIALFVVSGMIGIGSSIVWNQIWKPNSNLTIEIDLRYDCLPLQPKFKEECNPVCRLDRLAKETDIRCYYQMERSEDLENGRNFMPRYLVKKIDEFNYLLKLYTAPPFIHNDSNTDLHKQPIVQKNLHLSIRKYSSDHSSILIRPFNDDDAKWTKYFDFNFESHNNSIKSNAIITVENDVNIDFFQLKIRRRKTKRRLFDMGPHTPFIFADGYIEITTLLMNDLVYGLGQSNQPFKHNFSNPSKWNLFSQYHDNITLNTTSLFGSHPFYLGIDNPSKGDAYGVLLLNSFPLQAIINSRPSLTLRTIGGHLEFHFFFGPKPIDVMRQLQNFIYKPSMPPYWSLGFHICHTQCALPNLSNMIKKFKNMSIPFESECGTSMKIDRNLLGNHAKILHDNNMRWISATIPHILSPDGNLNAINHEWNNAVLIDSNTRKPFIGSMIGCDGLNRSNEQYAYYPDFFNMNGKNLFVENELNTIADGFILDWNTPVNFAKDSCPLMVNRFEWNYNYFQSLNENNPCLDSSLSKSSITDHQNFGEYLAVHNLYGQKQSKAVFKKFYGKNHNQNRRPFIMSLSTFLGSGRFGGHISIPINGTWEMLKYSMKQMLDFSLFAIPMTGFPVGGYKGEKREKDINLMRQWYQLASMQPFMIAYNGHNEMETQFIETMENTIRSAIKTRYRILPYLYTLFYHAAIDGDLVAQPLFFQFPDKEFAYKIQNQYMLGPALMISPALEMNKSSLSIHFPGGRWYDFYSGQIVWNKDHGLAELSVVNINIHLRGGHMIVLQDAKQTIEETRIENGFQLYGGFDRDKKSFGKLYIDDGNDHFPSKRSMYMTFDCHYNNLTINIQQIGDFCRAMDLNLQKKYNTNLETIKLTGVIQKPNQIDVYLLESGDNDRKIHLKTLNSNKNSIQFNTKLGVLIVHLDLQLCRMESNYKFFLSWNYE